MAATQTRIHQKIDEAEIDLVIQCNDSHEFYERYLREFPAKRKGIESISRIWKRRSEFMRKRQEPEAPLPPAAATSPAHNLDSLIAVQNKLMAEMTALMKEHLQVSKEILSILKNDPAEPAGGKPETKKTKRRVAKVIETKEPVQPVIVKKRSPILVGS
jgi:hypothetical protein